MTQTCDGCGVEISVAGGIANIWSTEPTHTSGMTLELPDGSEHLLCFDCIEALPEEATAADVAALGDS
ncbi:DUF7561 family protein [Halodesulfurarchaeum formicicum]|uniref:Small CPxCG-related zinc finger protein n=1 Tax=Halodesulfurarchaeum formicicum TaxID=1873524 RepID=A0A1J1AFS1_9EURY|nr:hypothetical protein [Halodesulfurarchaeum formicicum]APE96519.1 hypothetical protein HSR6_2091 [Halodesulfurarchaeum formicicum]